MKALIAAALLFVFLAPLRALDAVGGAEAASGASHRPSLNHDGSRLAFESTARLVPEDTDKRQDVYVVDIPSGTPRRLPRSPGSFLAGGPALSADGRAVAYHVLDREGTSEVEALASIVLLELDSGKAHRVPPGWFGKRAAGEALYPALGKSGRFVAFSSNAAGLVLKRKLPVRGIFLFDASADLVRLISRGQDGSPANRPSAEPRMSLDGRYIGFLSAATNLKPPLPADSLAYHLYLADRWERTVTRVDEIERGFDPSGWIAGRFDMDDDAASLVFEARQRKSGKPADTLATTDLFLFETSSGAVTRLTSGLFAGRSHSPAVSGNGRWTAFIYDGTGKDKGGVVVYDRKRDLWRRIIDGKCAHPAISGDGRWIAFESSDPAVTGQKGALSRIYVAENPSYEEAEETDARD